MLKRLALALEGNNSFWLTRLDSGTPGNQKIMDFFFLSFNFCGNVRTAEAPEQVCQITLANSQCDNYNTMLYWKGKTIRKIIVTSILFYI